MRLSWLLSTFLRLSDNAVSIYVVPQKQVLRRTQNDAGVKVYYLSTSTPGYVSGIKTLSQATQNIPLTPTANLFCIVFPVCEFQVTDLKKGLIARFLSLTLSKRFSSSKLDVSKLSILISISFQHSQSSVSVIAASFCVYSFSLSCKTT